MTSFLHKSYEIARERYAEFGINTEDVLKQMGDYHLSFNSWHSERLPARGNPAREIEQLRQDFLTAVRLVPGEHRLTLQTTFAKKDVELLEASDLEDWMQWSLDTHTQLDLNVTTHNPDDRLTLSSTDPNVRKRWQECIGRCREIANAVGENQKSICLMNLQVNDLLDAPSYNRILHHQLLEESLNELFSSKMTWTRDSISSPQNSGNATPVASYNELISYAIRHQRIIEISTDYDSISPDCIVDGVSSLLLSLPGLVIRLSNPTQGFGMQRSFMDSIDRNIFLEIANSGIQHRIHYLLDYRNPSISRRNCYVMGARAAQRCIMRTLLEPIQMLHYYEMNGYHVEKTALIEESRTMPWGTVYDEFCVRNDVQAGTEIIGTLK